MPEPTNWAAGRYEAVAERIARIAADVVAAVDRRQPVGGTAVVDLACGTGSAALAAAHGEAHVTGVDLTPELIEIAAARPGGGAVHWVVADAARTGLPGGTFDAAVSNMGIIFVEPASLVSEVARLLRPGGIFGFSAWVRDDAGNPFYTPIVETLGQPRAGGYSPDQWGEPDAVAARLSTDFEHLSLETAMHTWHFDSVSGASDFIVNESPMHVDLLSRLEPEQQRRLVEAFRRALGKHADSTGQVSFTSPYLIATARRNG